MADFDSRKPDSSEPPVPGIPTGGDEPLCRDQAMRQEESVRFESLRQMAGGIAHDFNNLLTAILGNANLMLMDLPENSPFVRNLTDIVHAAERAADLSDQMLVFSGKRHPTLQRVDLSGLVREAARWLSCGLPDNVELPLALALGLPPIKADPAHLRQLLYNLVTNAHESMGPQGGTIHISTGEEVLSAEALAQTRLYRPSLTPGLYVRLCVRDNGQGMEEGVLPRVFDPFFSTKFTGRGLGLAVVRGILESHHATLAIDSTPGTGTTLRLYFPADV